MRRFIFPGLLFFVLSGACGDSSSDDVDAQTSNSDAGIPDSGGAPDASATAVCGDGVAEGGEVCDDGNTTDDGNGCSATCTRSGSCGNGTVEALFESCDPGLSPCCSNSCDGVAPATQPCRTAASACDLAETCDGVNLTCPSDALQPDGTSCTTCPMGANCAGCFSGACLDSRAFCSEILARGQSTGDGVYMIRPAATSSIATVTSTMSVYCDMTTDGGGWTMVYKKSRVVPGGGDLLWTGTATNTDLLPLLNRGLASVDYSNGFQNEYWGSFTQARVEVVTGTVAQKFVQFDLTGTTPTSWFAPDRHRSSSWSDLPTSPTFDNGANQAFRIGSGRSFYINRVWSGCPNDRGWLMISTIDTCSWEQRTGDPADIIYSKLTTESHIPNLTDTGFADTLVVFLR